MVQAAPLIVLPKQIELNRGSGLPSNFGPKALLADPSLLTHGAQGNLDNMGIHDGAYGAVCASGQAFITTMNATYIVEPILGERTVRVRVDGRLGSDDHTRIPHPFEQSYPHFPCIRQRNDEPVWAVLWWTPRDDDFEAMSAQVVSGLVRLSARRLEALNAILTVIYQAASDLVALRLKRKEKPEPSIPQLQAFARHIISRLLSSAMPAQKLIFSVAEVQRVLLELDALVQYLSVYLPNMSKSLPADSRVRTSTAPVVGAVFTDAWRAELYASVGVPVWLYRGTSDLPATRVEKSVKMITVKERGVELAYSVKYTPPTIFTGPVGVERQRAIEKFSIALHRTTDPAKAFSASAAQGLQKGTNFIHLLFFDDANTFIIQTPLPPPARKTSSWARRTRSRSMLTCRIPCLFGNVPSWLSITQPSRMSGRTQLATLSLTRYSCWVQRTSTSCTISPATSDIEKLFYIGYRSVME